MKNLKNSVYSLILLELSENLICLKKCLSFKDHKLIHNFYRITYFFFIKYKLKKIKFLIFYWCLRNNFF